LSYIRGLESELGIFHPPIDEPEGKMETEVDGNEEMDADVSDGAPLPPLYDAQGGKEDYETASGLKQEAANFLSDGNIESALDKYTEAILAAPPSALLYANRATALYKLRRYRSAERDCNEALKENPDSAKALRMRGKVRKELGMWDEALHDLSASQQIDYDESTVEDLKFLTEKRLEHEKMNATERIEQEARLRKKAAEIKKAKEDSAREAQEESQNTQRSTGAFPGGMPGMPGMPTGGMGGGMPGGGMEGMMGALLSDPELMTAMQNPKIQAAFQELMSGPGGPMGLMSNPKLQEMMRDPEVGPVLQKLMSTLGAGSGANIPTGMESNDDDDDGIPNLDDLDGDVDLDKFQ
jgi:suppressor of tumorigenicity protein 13